MAGAGAEEEALALRDGERRRAVVELVLDLPGEHVAPMAVRAPLLTRRPCLVLDDRPSLPERGLRAGVNVRLVVGPCDRLEVELAAGAHARIVPDCAKRCSRNSTW